uniref:WW domain-containing protein n=1 Tax=Ciona savignyi TaxID=51511 RepID=H2YHV7_CIOSA
MTEGEIPMPTGWVSLFDRNLGRIVFVNQNTGFTSLTKPSLSLAATSINKKRGLHSTLYTPNLPVLTSKTPRLSLSRICDRNYINEKNNMRCVSEETSNMVVFHPKAHSCHAKVIQGSTEIKLLKSDLTNLQVIGQIERKFIACVARTSGKRGNLLLFDQHAAHERIRLENFISDSYESESKTTLKSFKLREKFKIIVTEEQAVALHNHPEVFRKSGLSWSFESINCHLYILGAPAILQNYVSLQATTQALIQERTEAFSLNRGASTSMSPILFQILCSKACHGAIRFGDILTFGQCSSLLVDLSHCDFPFQCAHGRPSVHPLLDLNMLNDKPERFNFDRLKKM